MNAGKLIICFMAVLTAGILFHFTIQRGLEPTEMDSIGLIFLYGAIEASIATFVAWLFMKIAKK